MEIKFKIHDIDYGFQVVLFKTFFSNFFLIILPDSFNKL